MFRTSSYLVIALSITAIASATTPAAALPSQFMGGASNHLVPQIHPATAATSVRSSLEAHHVLTPVSPPPQRVTPGNSSGGKAEMPMSKPAGNTSLGTIEQSLPRGPIGFPPHVNCEAGCNRPPAPVPDLQPHHPQSNPGPVGTVVPQGAGSGASGGAL